MTVPVLRMKFTPNAPQMRAKVTPAIPPQPAQFRSDGTYIQWRIGSNGTWENLVALADLEVPADGDYGDLTVSAGGATWTIDPSVISPFGRTLTDDDDASAALSTLGFSAFIKTLIDDADAPTARATLGAAEAAAGDIAFATRALAAAYAPAVAPATIRTLGYAAAGDGGHALYVKVVSEPSHGGKFSITLSGGATAWYEIVEGTEINVLAFGLVGDGATANDTAFKALEEYAFRAADLYSNVRIAFPRGDFVFTSDNAWGKWVTSAVARGHVVIKGAGKYATTIRFKPTGSGTYYLYNGEAGTSGVGSNNQWIGIIFKDLMFRVDATNITGGGQATLFRQFPKAGVPAQNFQFENCYFQGSGTAALSVVTCAGSINASENVFINCTARNFTHILELRNPQAVNHYAIGCNWELMLGDVYYTNNGGQITTIGGSIILSSSADAYLINAEAGVSGLTSTIAFYGVRTELRNAYAKLCRLTGADNGIIAMFDGCDFVGGIAGGARDAVVVAAQSAAKAIFRNCNLASTSLTYRLLTATANYWLSAASNGEIHIRNCKVPSTIHDLVTWESNAKGLFRVRECYTGGGAVTGSPTLALDCDMLNGGFGRPRNGNGSQQKTAQGLVYYWPTVTLNRSGDDSQISLPPGAMITAADINKVAYGSSASSYQLALTNGDGSFCYGLSTIAQQQLVHSIAWSGKRVLTSAADKVLKLTSTVTIAYDTQTGNFALGETVTGETSGATGVVVLDVDAGATGTLTLALTTGTFQAAEALTGSVAGAANCVTVTSRLGGAVAQTMAAGDSFGVTYW